MKTKIISCIVCILTILPLVAQKKPSSEAEVFFNNTMSQINPRHVAWIKSTAKTILEKNMSDVDAKKLALQYGSRNNLNNSDIEVLISLVMMQTAKDAQEDLKRIMSQLNSLNEQKKHILEVMKDLEQHKNEISGLQLDSLKTELKMQPFFFFLNTTVVARPIKMTPTRTIQKNQIPTISKPVPKEEINKVAKDINDKMDTLSEMSEANQLKMQMYMDRYNKALRAVSNAMKKFSDTSSSIIQNLK